MRAVVEHHAEDPRARVISILHHLFQKRPFWVVGRHVADALAEVDFLSKVGHEFRGFIGGQHAERRLLAFAVPRREKVCPDELGNPFNGRYLKAEEQRHWDP